MVHRYPPRWRIGRPKLGQPPRQALHNVNTAMAAARAANRNARVFLALLYEAGQEQS
jgi:hypothetical protein